ncbi:hypothetical protein EAH87_06920 [Sphingomonas koreensis]|nr:hypothetical protein EAH87_06920 [Sphingomonas koreensis]
MTTELYPIEHAAIEAIIRQYPSLANALAVQLEKAHVTGRRNTGAGFYTNLHVADDAPLASTASPIGDPFASVEGLEHGMGFLLTVRDGKMACLEGYSFEDYARPIEFETVTFSITDGTML